MEKFRAAVEVAKFLGKMKLATRKEKRSKED